MTNYQYAVIIPAWNEAEYIESCIASIKTAMSRVPYSGQLIVVDNNSTDDTAQLAQAAGAQVVFEPINQISRARNAGADAANASMFVFVDADSHIDAPLLHAALDAIELNNNIGGGAWIRGDREPGLIAWLGINKWNWISRTFKLAAGCFVYVRADAFIARQRTRDGFSYHYRAHYRNFASQTGLVFFGADCAPIFFGYAARCIEFKTVHAHLVR